VESPQPHWGEDLQRKARPAINFSFIAGHAQKQKNPPQIMERIFKNYFLYDSVATEP